MWPKDRHLSVYWSPGDTPDRSEDFRSPVSDTLFGGRTERIPLGEGNFLNVIDPSVFYDFVDEHAWHEGDEVAGRVPAEGLPSPALVLQPLPDQGHVALGEVVDAPHA